jgi:hypothetical protein
MNNNINNEDFACALLEAKYIKQMKEQNYEEIDIIPHNWYESNDSRLKIKMLGVAISENKLLSQVPGIENLNEGIELHLK